MTASLIPESAGSTQTWANRFSISCFQFHGPLATPYAPLETFQELTWLLALGVAVIASRGLPRALSSPAMLQYKT
jgi:hypothetical protein